MLGHALRVVISSATPEKGKFTFLEDATEFAKSFLKEIFEDIRASICGRSKYPKCLGPKSEAALAALAAFLAKTE